MSPDLPERDLPGSDLLVTAALQLYPRDWRARYGEEIRALVAEEGGRVAAAVSLAWGAAPAWVLPMRHLRDRDACMRSSVGTVLAAWAALTAIGAVFVQLTQLQGFRAARHPPIGWAYLVFDVALAASVLVAAIGGPPLWLQMLRQARRERQSAMTALLAITVASPAAGFAVAGMACAWPLLPAASRPPGCAYGRRLRRRQRYGRHPSRAKRRNDLFSCRVVPLQQAMP
jgi:hypothetical protein